MKARILKTLCPLVMGCSMLLLTGCNKDTRTAMWWMPNPWSPATWFWAPASSVTGDSSAAAGGGAGGGGNNFNTGTGGGYNVGGGVPGAGF